MVKIVKVQLSKQGLKQFLLKLEDLKTGLKEAKVQTVSEIAEYGRTQLENNYSSSVFTDGNDDVSIFAESNGNNAKFGARGTQVSYREFGTGTEGASSPHPLKGQFGLNAYNSGRTIRGASENISNKTGIPIGQLYWTYMDKSGQIVYTTGIPAGMEVYNASLAVKKEASKIAKRKVSEVLSKI